MFQPSSPCLASFPRRPCLCAVCCVHAQAAAPGVDLARLRPKAVVKCGKGVGMAVCEALGLIVTSNYSNHSISAYRLTAPDYPHLGTWGGKGDPRLPFDFSSGDDVSGGMCFTVAAGAPVAAGTPAGGAGAAGADGAPSPAPAATTPLLLVASHGTDAVVVLDVAGLARGGGGGRGEPVPAGTFARGTGAAPRRVAASAGLVAVSGWTKDGAGDHTVTLYTAHAPWARVRVVGVGRGHGPGDGQLHRPRGMLFTADGSRVLVADGANHRVCSFRVADGGYDGVVASEVAHGLSYPWDVVEVSGGVVVADWGSHRVVRVPADGSPVTALGGVKGSEPGQFSLPTALHVSPDGAQVIVREWGNGRFQVFGL